MLWNCIIHNVIGQPFEQAANSPSASIFEGFGRYSKKDKIKLYRDAQGAIYESFGWSEK